jgi:predicted nucleic-acid-binding protein
MSVPHQPLPMEEQTTVELTTVVDVSTKKKRPSIMEVIKEKQNSQDFNQKLNVAITLILEIYRVLMGALLVVFVPQKCEDTICSASQNVNRDDKLTKAAFSFNIITAFSFLALYFIEVKRENKLISYMEVNKFTASDNDSVEKALQKLSVVKKQKIWDYDGYYQKCGYASTISFTINAILSFIVVYQHYLDSKTMTVFFTNILLMGLKVADVFSIANTSKNIFYSAYLKNRVQYNDVDPDKIQLADDSAVKIDINPDTAIADTKAIHDVLDTIIVNVSKEIEAMDIDGEPKVEELPDDSDDDTNFLVEKSSIDDNISAQPTDELVQSKDAFVAEDNVRLEYVYKQKSESATFQESHPYINSDESNTESAENNTETVQSNTETVQSNTESADNSV